MHTSSIYRIPMSKALFCWKHMLMKYVGVACNPIMYFLTTFPVAMCYITRECSATNYTQLGHRDACMLVILLSLNWHYFSLSLMWSRWGNLLNTSCEHTVSDSQIWLRDRNSHPDTWSRTSLVWIFNMITQPCQTKKINILMLWTWIFYA